jgi:predicted RNase H-like HicB family nuclease
VLTIELIADAELGGFTARVPDIPAYGEGETQDEAIADLREALTGYIEQYGIADAMSRVSEPELKTLDLELAELANG